MVLRVVNFSDEIRTALLGLNKYELYNALEEARERLTGGVVTNLSLYTTCRS